MDIRRKYFFLEIIIIIRYLYLDETLLCLHLQYIVLCSMQLCFCPCKVGSTTSLSTISIRLLVFFINKN